MNAIELLKSEHRQIGALFHDFESARAGESQAEIAERICEALTVQMALEEQIFFPAFLKATDDAELLQRAEVELEVVRMILARIDGTNPGDAHYEARFGMLARIVRAHFETEERRDGMFAEACCAGLDLEALGAVLQARRRELRKCMLPPRPRRGTAINADREAAAR